jgi:hypothetical protein
MPRPEAPPLICSPLPDPISPQQRAVMMLVHLLHAGASTTAELAAVVGGGLRQTRDALTQLHGVLRMQKEGQGPSARWSLPHASRRQLGGVDDQVSMHLGRGLLAFAPPLMPPAPEGPGLRHLERKFHAALEPARDYSRQGAILATLQQALLDERRVDLVYAAPHAEPEPRPGLQPLCLVVHRGAVYLHVRRDGPAGPEERTYAVERIQSAALGEPVPYPDDFDPARTFGERWAMHATRPAAPEVRLRFTPEVAPYVQARRWPGELAQRGRKGGHRELILRAEGPGLLSWILSWGPAVEVVSPPELRAQVAAALQQAAARYRDRG